MDPTQAHPAARCRSRMRSAPARSSRRSWATRSSRAASSSRRTRSEFRTSTSDKSEHVVEKLNRLSESHGKLRFGTGLTTAVIALLLAVLCFLGVLAFHFPAYLTTPELRKSYNVETIRTIMLVAMVISGGASLACIILGRARWVASRRVRAGGRHGAPRRTQGAGHRIRRQHGLHRPGLVHPRSARLDARSSSSSKSSFRSTRRSPCSAPSGRRISTTSW